MLVSGIAVGLVVCNNTATTAGRGRKRGPGAGASLIASGRIEGAPMRSPSRNAPRRIPRASLATVGAVLLLGLPGAAVAACHTAAFTQLQIQVDEGGGQVELTVELVGGQPTCSGSVRYQTVNGSAQSPDDYTARTGELTFTPGDDRRESFTVPIINDDDDEGRESFTVRLSQGSQPGDIQPSSDPATVFISDNDDPPSPKATASARPTLPSKSAAASPTETSTASPGATPTATVSGTPRTDAAPAGSGGSGAGPLIAILALLTAAGGGLGVWLWRTRPT